jgi:hypothetical protein
LQQSASPQHPSADQAETGPASRLTSAKMAIALRIANQFTTRLALVKVRAIASRARCGYSFLVPRIFAHSFCAVRLRAF